MKRELKERYSWEELLAIISDLRDPEHGCPWDLAQTPESMRKYVYGEVDEVFQAIDARDDKNLCEELGDVLFEIILLAQMKSEEGTFTMDDVVSGIARKMIRRHPHVFGDAVYHSEEELTAAWENIKKEEKTQGHQES